MVGVEIDMGRLVCDPGGRTAPDPARFPRVRFCLNGVPIPGALTHPACTIGREAYTAETGEEAERWLQVTGTLLPRAPPQTPPCTAAPLTALPGRAMRARLTRAGGSVARFILRCVFRRKAMPWSSKRSTGQPGRARTTPWPSARGERPAPR